MFFLIPMLLLKKHADVQEFRITYTVVDKK